MAELQQLFYVKKIFVSLLVQLEPLKKVRAALIKRSEKGTLIKRVTKCTNSLTTLVLSSVNASEIIIISQTERIMGDFKQNHKEMRVL
jgi:hypothetical protein